MSLLSSHPRQIIKAATLPKPRPRVIAGVVLALAAALVLWKSFYVIDAGERGVILRLGAVQRTAEPGMGVLIPFVDRVVRISTQTQSAFYANIDTYSRDQQSASIDVSVIFHVDPDNMAGLYSEFGSLDAAVERELARVLPSAMKEVFGRFTAASSIQERERLGTEVQMAVKAAVDLPLVVDTVQMERISFSASYERSVEERMLAEVEVLKVNQNAAREKVPADIAVIRSRAEAEAVLARAEADAQSIRLRGEADAAAISARAKALSENPLVVDLIAAERWNGALPSTMVPDAALPFMDVE
jgi:regulator of protease activity HflC (stomatin/prohibitin superfamily)